ncbi:unnamed protein product [Periconia digitata]|uniref:Uncharacterized protein n=1 Tax=Periconia digitata TaxID=1303443 RepID=A0A9W4ULT4_9PLEO|nr:unnamed protein product [Periconia digitata]
MSLEETNPSATSSTLASKSVDSKKGTTVTYAPVSPNGPNTEYRGNESFASKEHKPGNHADARWLPYTLRGYLIWVPAGFSLALGLTVILLYWKSQKNNGIASASSAVLGWQFIPTLLAIVYTQLTTMLFEDVKRTEPFARLARHSDSPTNTSRTLLDTQTFWWSTLLQAFQKKHNGGRRSWGIVLACLVNVLAFMAISPLSSALLNPAEVAVSRPLQISRLIPKTSASMKAVDERDTYFRTLGSLLQNVTTSPWISDDYVVLPFRPNEAFDSRGVSSALEENPWDPQNADVPQIWTADTTIFRNNLKCSKLTVASKNVDEKTTTTLGSSAEFTATINLESSEGCQIKLSADAESSLGDIRAWYDKTTFATKNTRLSWVFDPVTYNKCDGEEVIFLSSGWLQKDSLSSSSNSTSTPQFMSNMTVTSHLCSSEHTMATLPVTVSVSGGTFSVDFDKDQFSKVKQPVSDKSLDLNGFKEVYTNPKWNEYVVAPREYLGLSSILGTHYNFDLLEMLADEHVPQNAMRIRGRHFGELLRTSLEQRDGSEVDKVSGTKTTTERRIIVRFEIAVALAALFFLSFLMLAHLTWISRLRQRPLNLTHDPATVLGCVSLIASNPQVLASLRHLDQSTQKELESELKLKQFYTSPGQLHERHESGRPVSTSISSKPSTGNEKRVPIMLKFRGLVMLLAYLLALLVTIAVLQKYASDNFFHKKFFIYQVNYGDAGIFVPFSVIPTIFGILLGLSWNALDRTFRSLQPYFAMSSKLSTKITDGAANTYESSHWFWASAKAAKHGHWLLSFVTLGTFVAQAFTVALSALFQQDIGYISNPVNLDRSLELRQTPHIRQINTTYPPEFNSSAPISDRLYIGEIVKGLFTNLSTNWMYTAEIQLTMNGSEPDWSKDGWSFVPTDLSRIGSESKTAIDDSTQSENDISTDQFSPVNVTLTTPAIRGRVECTRNEKADNLDNWGTISEPIAARAAAPMNMSLPSHDSTGHTMLKQFMFSSDKDFTPIAPDGRYMTCCVNQTDPTRVDSYEMPVAVGYWTSYYYNTSQAVESVTGTTGNFSVKWIHGGGGSPWSPMRQMIEFSETPKLQALHCMPVIERADANITVDKKTGKVQSYNLISTPTPDDSAWSESFVVRNLTNPDDPFVREQLARKKTGQDLKVVQNITTSYGVLFLNSLLRASRQVSWTVTNMEYDRSLKYEQVDDNAFNIRNNYTGLNLDFMSYASYIQAGKDVNALNDATTLIKHTQKTFTTFFQHYVSSSFSMEDGGWAYQPIGTSLKDVGSPAPGSIAELAPNGAKAVPVSKLPASYTQRTTEAMVTTRVEVLRMNRIAFYVCIAILSWLSATALAIMVRQRSYFNNLRRDIECVADVLVLVAGSERLLALVRDKGVDGLKGQNVSTRLGWFRDVDGRMRWGIEVVEDGEILME